MKNNYICPKTGKEFFFSITVSKFVGGEMQTFDKSTGKRLVNPENGEVLEYISSGEDIGAPMILGTREQVINRNKSYARKRAKDHANSADGKEMKRQAEKKEMKKYLNKK